MTKTQAVEIFGSVSALAHAVGVTRHAIYQWPDDLSQATADRVIGAALRHGKTLDEAVMTPSDEAAA